MFMLTILYVTMLDVDKHIVTSMLEVMIIYYIHTVYTVTFIVKHSHQSVINTPEQDITGKI